MHKTEARSENDFVERDEHLQFILIYYTSYFVVKI